MIQVLGHNWHCTFIVIAALAIQPLFQSIIIIFQRPTVKRGQTFYQNEGVLPFKFEYLKKICGRRIEHIWHKIEHKFKISRGKLQSSVVSEDIKRAKKLSQVQSAKALKRWGNNKGDDAAAMPLAMPSEAKRSKVK